MLVESNSSNNSVYLEKKSMTPYLYPLDSTIDFAPLRQRRSM